MNPEIKQTFELLLDLLWVFFIVYVLLKLTIQSNRINDLEAKKTELEAKLKQTEFIMAISDDISAEMFKENEQLEKQITDLQKQPLTINN